MYGSFDMSRLPFANVSDVEEDGFSFLEPPSKGRYVEHRRRLHLQFRCAPGDDPTGKVTMYVSEANRLQHCGHPACLLLAVGCCDDLALGVHHPGSTRAHTRLSHRHVYRAGNVSNIELSLVAPVDNDGARFGQLLYTLGQQGLERGGLCQERTAVELDDPLEVGRVRRLLGG